MAKRKRQTSGGEKGHKFNFHKDDSKTSEVMASPAYQKNAIKENFPMLATMWVECHQKFGPGCIVVDFLSMVPEDEIGDEIQFGLTYAPKSEALEAADNNEGLQKMFRENDPNYKVIVFVFHPKGQSFYHIGMEPASGYTLRDYYENNKSLIGEFQIPDNMQDRWLEKLEALVEESEQEEDDVSSTDDQGG